MAINECYGRHRRRQRLTELLSGFTPASPPESDPDLRALVEALPYRERTVVVLHYGHGLTLEEVAGLLAEKPSTIRSVLFRARAKLRAQLSRRARHPRKRSRPVSADDFELRLAQAARSLVAEPVSIDVIRAAAAFSARTSVKPRTRASGRLIGIFAVVLAIVLAGLAISPGSPIRRLLVATVASPSPTVNSSSPAPASTATAASTSVPTMVAGPSPSGSSTPDALTAAATCSRSPRWRQGFRFFRSRTRMDRTRTSSSAAGSSRGRRAVDTSSPDTGQREIVIDMLARQSAHYRPAAPAGPTDDHVLVLDRRPTGRTTSPIGLYDVSGTLVRSYPAPDGVTCSVKRAGHRTATRSSTRVVEGCSLDVSGQRRLGPTCG